MAEIHGSPGSSAAVQSRKHLEKGVWVAVSIMSAAAFSMGLIAANPTATLLTGTLAALGMSALLLKSELGKFFEKSLRDKRNWLKGSDGEARIAETLYDLPDGYVVISDIKVKFGNIDHVVIGPTGIYLIDSKHWRGTVSAAPHHQLLLNGKAVKGLRELTHSVMAFHDKIKALCEKDYYVRGLMVFACSYLELAFKDTEPIHCVRRDEVLNYLTNSKFSGRLNHADISRVKLAVRQLLAMGDASQTPDAAAAAE